MSLNDSPKAILKSLAEAREAVKQGELVCIFAEGALTRTGNMLPFNRGFEYIMKDVDAPIIPVYLDRMWGSIFSYDKGKFFWKMPRLIPYPATVCFGKPMAAKSKAYQVRTAVQELGAEAFILRKKRQKKMHIAFIDEVKKHPFKFAVADSTNVKMNYAQLLTSIILMSKKLFGRKSTDKYVGVLLPASAGAAIANGAILFAGKTPVNLNFTASEESIESAMDQCEMERIITSRRFLEKANMKERDNMVFLEDVKKTIDKKEKLSAFLSALLLPSFFIKRLFVKGDIENIDDIATIIFSSGSTGEPKGVMLSHANITSNIEGLYQVLQLERKDVIMGVLPFFHSFGFTATLCFPLGLGIGVVYHSNPLDAGTVGKLVKKYKATMLMGTPTFFSAYIRKCTQEQFKTIRYAVAGAEKLKKQVADTFYEKFNIVPFEGYGATELSPIVSMGIITPDLKDEPIQQIGNKPGTVGHPLPGIAVKVIDQETGELLPYDNDGILLVKGANVMKGYLKNDAKTNEVIKDGWYYSGDIARIDQDGFIQITDRLSRFSKIGGEMVPHVKIEEEILKILEASDPICVVTAIPDEKKGERLAVLYTEDIDVEDVWNKLNEQELPKLWIPKKENFYRIDSIPLLGSGKFDLKKIKEVALASVHSDSRML